MENYVFETFEFSTGNFIMSLSYLVKVNNRFRMDADELQARPVALEELCKQPEKDSPHLLVLKKHTQRQTIKPHQTAMPQMQYDKFILQ